MDAAALDRSDGTDRALAGRRPEPASPHALWLAAWKPVVLALYAAWIVFVGWHHEPFADEAQAWLIGRDASLGQIFGTVLHYEGSPGLWHALLWALNRLHLPYEALFLVSAACGIAGAALVLWRAPFPSWMRVAVLVSYFYGYQFPVVARSYALDLVLVPLAACWFAQRTRQPLRYGLVIALIASCNSHGFCAAAVMGLEFAWALWRDAGRPLGRALAGLGLAALGGLATIVTVWPAPDTMTGNLNANPPLAKVLFMLSHAFLDRVLVLGGAPQLMDQAAGLVLGLVLITPTLLLLAKGRHALLAFGCMAAILLFSATVHAAEWHAGILWLFWLFGLWISWETARPDLRKGAAVSFALLAALQGVQSVETGLWDVRHVYSPGRAVAARIAGFRMAHPHARVAVYLYNPFAAVPYFAGDPFDNPPVVLDRPAPARPAYAVWSLRSAWRPVATPESWRAMLATRPDLIVTGQVPASFRAPGYSLRAAFAGNWVWRGHPETEDRIYLLERTAPGGAIR